MNDNDRHRFEHLLHCATHPASDLFDRLTPLERNAIADVVGVALGVPGPYPDTDAPDDEELPSEPGERHVKVVLSAAAGDLDDLRRAVDELVLTCPAVRGAYLSVPYASRSEAIGDRG